MSFAGHADVDHFTQSYLINMAQPTEAKELPKLDGWGVFQKALRRAGEGGIAGAAAMGINVCSLMWIRTTINYQYRYGTSTTQAFKALYADGGVVRYCVIIFVFFFK